MACLALSLAAGATSVTAFGGSGADELTATFEASAVADPTIVSCRALGAAGHKIEARYQGTFTIPAQERRLTAHLSLEVLVDRAAGVGVAEGTWWLGDSRTELAGRGELLAVVNMTTPPDPEAKPPDPNLELHGLLTGTVSPPEPTCQRSGWSAASWVRWPTVS